MPFAENKRGGPTLFLKREGKAPKDGILSLQQVGRNPSGMATKKGMAQGKKKKKHDAKGMRKVRA